jgi:diadenosine tetraphosphate (Ap4A) HIT family hydrolase
MFARFYDPENKYSAGILKEYAYWILETSYRQHTFGCYIVFCKRKGVEKISELTVDELVEFTQVLRKIESALIKNPTFKPNRFNYWQMGNGLHSLHFHGIPRYATPRIFAEKIWEDKTYVKKPDVSQSPVWSMEEQSEDVVKKIQTEILNYL